MRIAHTIAIVGPGFIGGSLGLGIKKKHLCAVVLGVSRHKETILYAKKVLAIDHGAHDIHSIKDADLVILATPIDSILSIAPRLARILKPSCVVTDVASAKAKIVARLEKIFPNYLGSHPMAGSEKHGILHAKAELFTHSLCILTPTRRTNKRTLAMVKNLWNALGARIVCLSPEEHDEIIAFVSHLPHAAAFSLINAIPLGYLRFSASGLRDTTRIASSDNKLWASIFLANRKKIVRGIASLEKELKQLKNILHNNDYALLARFLLKANKKRASLPL